MKTLPGSRSAVCLGGGSLGRTAAGSGRSSSLNGTSRADIAGKSREQGSEPWKLLMN